jgi:general secretion pathway protein A
MYEQFYGFVEKPFNILPDPDYLFMSKVHENAYTHLEYAVMENKGFVVVTGEIGSGKTTLINYLIGKIEQDIQIGLINQTYVSPTQFIKMVCQDFELNVEGLDKAEMVDHLHHFLLDQFAHRERVILIIDEAQNLTPKTMEELRMLSNLEAEKHHLIQMILVGQPELKLKLQRKDLVQFAQRVTVNCHLSGLSLQEVTDYIAYRVKVAGAENQNIFNTESIAAIYKHSGGIPRLINVICDAALVYGFADELPTISGGVVAAVVKERMTGGLMADGTEPQAKEFIAKAESPVSQGLALPGQNQDVGRRFKLMENRLDYLDQRLTLLSKNHAERDQVIVELIKMLKNSLKSRFKTLMEIRQIKDR